MKRNAYVRVDGQLRGIITLTSGERFVFNGGRNILFILFPFLCWFLPISCWRDDDLAEDINQHLGSKRSLGKTMMIGLFGALLAKVIPLNDSIRIPFQIPIIIWVVLVILVVIGVIKFITRRMSAPKDLKVYQVRIYPQKYGIIQGIKSFVLYLILMSFVAMCFSTLIGYLFPAILLFAMASVSVYIFLFGLMNVHDCRVEFIKNK